MSSIVFGLFCGALVAFGAGLIAGPAAALVGVPVGALIAVIDHLGVADR